MNKSQELLLPYSCLNSASSDEPVFVLRANDPIAAQTIRHWVTMAANVHTEEKRDKALQVAIEFDQWQKNIPQAACPTPQMEAPRVLPQKYSR